MLTKVVVTCSLGGDPMKGVPVLCNAPRLTGDVAIGKKNGSTFDCVTAVCNAARKRRGPAGLGMIMISGNKHELVA